MCKNPESHVINLPLVNPFGIKITNIGITADAIHINKIIFIMITVMIERSLIKEIRKI